MEKLDRKDSNVSDLDLSDTKHCLLCLNDLKIAAIGPCNHKHVCANCTLRLRLLMKDFKCTICKEQLDKVFIVNDLSQNYEDLQQMEDDLYRDPDDGTVIYLNEDCKNVCLYPRLYICRIGKCRTMKEFNNLVLLRRHLERDHKRTFCDVCLQNRLVFLLEQKTYFLNKLDHHFENGDPGDNQCAQIHPHPFCNFCQRYFFNDVQLQDHLFKEHMTCSICGDEYKNWYYANYKSLENHFDKTHYLCKNKGCLKSLFVAFKTQEELVTHNYMVHQSNNVDKRKVENVNLLGFNSFGPNQSKNKKGEEIVFKDEEAIDFGWYFSEEYKAKGYSGFNADSQGKYRDNKSRGNRRRDQEESKQRPIGDLKDDDEKVEKILMALRKYLRDMLPKMGALEDSMRYAEKATIKHLYKIIGKLTPDKFVRYDYLMNFGVSVDSKVILQKAVENARSYDDFKSYLDKIPFKQALMMHKYYTFAQKRIKVIMYNETIDEVSADLLKEIDSTDEKKPTGPKEVSNKKAATGKVVVANK